MRRTAIMAVFLMLFAIGCKTVDVDSRQKSTEGFEIVITPDEGRGSGEVMPSDTEEAMEDTGTIEEPRDMIQEAKPDSGSTSLGEDKCDETAVLGFVSCLRKGDDLEITLRNVGRGDLQGVYERFYDTSYNMIGANPDLFDFNMGVENVFLVPMSKFAYTWKVDVHPVQGNDICSNQQLVIIPETNCR